MVTHHPQKRSPIVLKPTNLQSLKPIKNNLGALVVMNTWHLKLLQVIMRIWNQTVGTNFL